MGAETRNEMIDTAAAARYLGISRTKLYALVKYEGLKAFKVGDGPRAPLRFRVAWLDEFVDQKMAA